MLKIWILFVLCNWTVVIAIGLWCSLECLAFNQNISSSISFYALIHVNLRTWCFQNTINLLSKKLSPQEWYLSNVYWPTSWFEHCLSSGNACEVYDPYTGTVMTMVVGPPAHCPGAPVLAALPCQPLPLQPLEWAPPAPGPWCYTYNRKKRYSTDSQVRLHLSFYSHTFWTFQWKRHHNHKIEYHLDLA